MNILKFIIKKEKTYIQNHMFISLSLYVHTQKINGNQYDPLYLLNIFTNNTTYNKTKTNKEQRTLHINLKYNIQSHRTIAHPRLGTSL